MPVVLTGPPPGRSPLGFCAVCAAAWKAAALTAGKDEITEASAAPAGSASALVALAPREPPPDPAVAWTLVVLPAPPGSPAEGSPVIVPMPACWTHLQAVNFTSSGLVAVPPGGVLLDGAPGLRRPPARP